MTASALTGIGQSGRSNNQRGNSEENIDEEDPTPRKVLDDESTGQQSERRGRTKDRTEEPDWPL
jgi:hypothetical protein